jgi:hypothetical protein
MEQAKPNVAVALANTCAKTTTTMKKGLCLQTMVHKGYLTY